MARIATIGQVDHHTTLHLDRLPAAGGSATVIETAHGVGGSTATIAMSLARLGEAVTLRAVVGNDEVGDQAIRELTAHGVDCAMVTRADATTASTTTLIDTNTGDRAILRQEGAAIRMGDRLDIAALFDHDLVILDMSDAPLRRFLTDLPAHTRPDVRLLGTLNHLVDNGEPDAHQIAFRFDTIIGAEHQFRQLLDVRNGADLIGSIQRQMPGANLRAAILIDGSQQCRWVTRDNAGVTPSVTASTIYSFNALDVFVAGIAWGMVRRLPWPETTSFATAAMALNAHVTGSQASLPSLNEVQELLDRQA